jgi:hypothetical protein
LRLGDLHGPNSFLFSSHHHFSVWIFLRFNLSSNSVTVHRFVRPQLVSLIIHLQIGCILPCSCLCYSIHRQGVAILARLTEHRWSITRGDVVLRLRDWNVLFGSRIENVLFGSRIESCSDSTKSRAIRTFRKIGNPSLHHAVSRDRFTIRFILPLLDLFCLCPRVHRKAKKFYLLPRPCLAICIILF